MGRTILVTDDIDGSKNATERRFSVGDANYLIDLTDENYAKFLAAIEPWREVARVERKGTFKLSPDERDSIRAWAQANGLPIKDRGRFPHAVVQAYFDALDEESHS